MPRYQQTIAARNRARRIREVHFGFKRERADREESETDIRRALHSVSASEFLEREAN